MDSLSDSYGAVIEKYLLISDYTGPQSSESYSKYYEEFMSRCVDYNLKNDGDRLITPASIREAKIKRFKRKKALEDRIKELRKLVEQAHVDDEVKRDYYTSLVHFWICTAEEDLQSLQMEQQILQHKDKQKTNQDLSASPSSEPHRKPVEPLKPFILTRDAVQAAVFGAGYPSLPTMTIDEFYEQQVQKGILPPPSEPKPVSCSNGGARFRRIDPSDEERAAEEARLSKEDSLDDAYDEERLMKSRKWDEFKDDHRRGEGNRMNRA